MAKLTISYTQELESLESLVVAVEEHRALLPTCGTYHQALVEQLTKIREGKARRDSAIASRQKATQDLQELLTGGQEIASRLRRAVQVDLGLKSEQLVQFGIAPQRKRRRSKTPLIEKPAQGGGANPGKEVTTT